MRVLVNMTSQFEGKPSGVAVVTFRLLERLLVQTEHDYILLSPWSRAALPAPLAQSRLDVLVRPRPRVMVADIVTQAIQGRALSTVQRIDAVLNMDPFGSATAGARRITVVHDVYFKEIGAQYNQRQRTTNDLIMRAMVRTSNALVCVSDATRTTLERHYPAAVGKAVTIHSGPSLLAAESPGDSGDSRPLAECYFLAVGNTTPNKNFAILGKAFSRLHADQPDLRLVHFGFDPDDTLTAAMPASARQAVVRLRNQSDGDLANLYRHAEALCIPSIAEGFCLPILEAQQIGCPVICSNTSAMPEIAGIGALLFDPTSSHALEGAMRQMIENANLRGQMIQHGIANLRRFSWAETARKYAVTLALTDA